MGERGTGGFTLIELLVVIAILGVLATAVVLVINPAELLKQGRDATRLSDLASLQSALSLFQTDRYDQGLGTASTTYVSIPDTSPACADLGLPSLPAGWSYHCAPPSTYTKTDGSGWIPVNFGLISSGSPLSKLPIDPVNTTSSGLYYTYTPGGSFELTALPESSKYRAEYVDHPSLQAFPGVIAMGSDTNLSPLYNAEGLVGYWPLDGDAKDMSGNGNDGTLVNGPIWTSDCESGECLTFDGNAQSGTGGTNYVSVNSASDLNFTNGMTWIIWLKTPDVKGTVAGDYGQGILYKKSDPSYAGSSMGYDIWQKISEGYFMLNLGDGVNAEYKLWSYSTTLNAYDNQWFMLGISLDAFGDVKFYINGILKSTQQFSVVNLTGGLSNSNDLFLGKGNEGSWDGSMDNIRIYGRALSPAEIQALYNAEK